MVSEYCKKLDVVFKQFDSELWKFLLARSTLQGNKLVTVINMSACSMCFSLSTAFAIDSTEFRFSLFRKEYRAGVLTRIPHELQTSSYVHIRIKAMQNERCKFGSKLYGRTYQLIMKRQACYYKIYFSQIEIHPRKDENLTFCHMSEMGASF